MSNNSEKFNAEDLVKKIQEGDTSLLIISGFLLLIPVIAILLLSNNPKEGKKMSQEKIKSMVQRKNVFNFGTKNAKGGTSAPRSGSSSSSSGWFTSRTQEQIISDEISAARAILEKSMKNVSAPPDLYGDAKLQYEAEHNYNLCMANGAIEEGRFELAEDYLKKAIDEAGNNPFLTAYAFAALCNLYETSGNYSKLESAYKAYIEAVGKLPEEFGGGDLKSIVRNAYQSLQALSNSADQSKVSSEISKQSAVINGDVPGNVDLSSVYQNFPIKYK